jgi:hypothetical protein
MGTNITRTAAVTTEQVITNKKARLWAVVPELDTTGTLKLRSESAAVEVLAPTTIAAAAAAGGSLGDDEYFINVLAVDVNGELSGEGTEDSATTSGGNNSVSVTWDAMANAASYRVYVGLSTGVYDGYFNVPTGEAFTVVSTSYDAAGDTPAGIPTSGNDGLKHQAAIGALQAGKNFGGPLFVKGITIQQSIATDRCAVIWEAV